MAARPAVRRLLVIGGLVVTGWLLGGLAGTAHADVSPRSALGDVAQRAGIGEGPFRAVPPAGLPAGPAVPGAGPSAPDARPSDDDVLRRIGDLLPERLPEVVNPPGGHGRAEPDPSERTVPADPGDASPPRGQDRDAGGDDTVRTGPHGPGTATGPGASTGGAHHSDEDRLSHVRSDGDSPPSPMGGDWLLPAAGPAFAGVGGLPGGYLGQSGRAERPRTVPSPRPAMDVPAVRTAVDEPSFAPD